MCDCQKKRFLILGAAGRDFHNFNVYFRNNKNAEVVGFTATQIPQIEGRLYPPSLSGPLYPEGLQIWSEDDLEKIIEEKKVNVCILAYSDLPHSTVMSISTRVLACGANFLLQGFKDTMIKSTKPVIAITAIRTGCGKSQTSRYTVATMKKLGKKVCVVRHPMPYGDLAKQAVQRFETYEDLKKHNVTIEEREEYEQHIDTNTVVYAGVDYEAILREVEKECDIVLWDGGNNDTPFFRPDLWITIVDPHRPNHELTYYPGDSNFRASDVLVINKVNTADPKNVQIIKDNIAKFNPKAKVFETNSVVVLDKPELVKGKKVVLVEDGPTLTHGEMKYGAGKVAADRYEVAEIIDPKPYAVGSILATYKKYPHVGDLIPAMGYFPEQIADLEKTINTVPCEAVIIATPMDLRGLINVEKPSAVAKYHSEDADPNNTLEALLTEFINKL